MAHMFLAILFVFVGTVVVSAADEKQDYVEQNFGSFSADQDPHHSSVIAAKNGFRVFTNTPENGLKETLTVTYSDGLYVAGEKVITEREHRRVVSELQSTRDELQSALDILNLTRTSLQETQSEVIALVQALREVSPANNSLILQPPICEGPGGDKLHFNGTHWECVCKEGYRGVSCQHVAWRKLEKCSLSIDWRVENNEIENVPTVNSSEALFEVNACRISEEHGGCHTQQPIVFIEISLPFTFDAIRGELRYQSVSGSHPDDNSGPHSIWHPEITYGKGYVMFGTLETILYPGGKAGGNFDSYSAIIPMTDVSPTRQLLIAVAQSVAGEDVAVDIGDIFVHLSS